MKKLLNRSMKPFVLYAAIVLACSIPVYYFIVDLIWQHELKEHNRIVAAGIRQNLQRVALSDSGLQQSILLWNRLRPEARLQEADRLRQDSTYNIYRKNIYIPAKGKDRFQGLVTYFEIKGKPFSLAVETNMEETHETMLAITLVTSLFFIILFGGFIVLNRNLSVKLWRPFYQSLQKLQDFDLQKQEPIIFEPGNIIEFETLNNSLDKLLAANIISYRQQKEFIENASHELQTPLAVVQSKLDLLLQSSSLTGEQSGLIDQIQQALSRVTHINKNLLLLARIENSQFPRTETVDLSALVKENMEVPEAFAKDKQVTVIHKIKPGISVQGNKILIEILVNNLLLNAARYSAPGSMITVSLTDRVLEISNNGSESLRKENLFKRFHTASSQTPGTGLGLAIVQQVSVQYGWKAAYRFENGLHVFSVAFL